MPTSEGTFVNRLNVDLFFQTWARIEGERAGVQITYKGKRLKPAADARRPAEEPKRERVNA